ncbi:MAG: rod shape-determining protein MreD [Pseudomonadota bacterium]
MSERADVIKQFAKGLTPTLLGLVGVAMLALPLRLFEGTAPLPLIPLLIVFFWSIYAPDYLPAPSIFVIGLLQDLYSGGPIGLWALIYLGVQYTFINQRSYFLGREQRVVWVGFMFATALAGAAFWAMTSLAAGNPMPLRPLALQLILTIAAYPVLAIAFSHLQRRVIAQR